MVDTEHDTGALCLAAERIHHGNTGPRHRPELWDRLGGNSPNASAASVMAIDTPRPARPRAPPIKVQTGNWAGFRYPLIDGALGLWGRPWLGWGCCWELPLVELQGAREDSCAANQPEPRLELREGSMPAKTVRKVSASRPNPSHAGGGRCWLSEVREIMCGWSIGARDCQRHQASMYEEQDGNGG